METKKDRSPQHRHHIKEDKKGTHNKADKQGALRTRPLFLMPFTRAQRQEYWHVLTNKNSKGTKQFALNAVTDGVHASYVADLVQSS